MALVSLRRIAVLMGRIFFFPFGNGRVSLPRAVVFLVGSVYIFGLHLLVDAGVITTYRHCCGKIGFWLDVSRCVVAAALQVFIICRRVREARARRRLPPPPPPEMDLV